MQHNRDDIDDGGGEGSVPANVASGFIIKEDSRKRAAPEYSNVASKLMKKMGFEEGKGLGKAGQGRVNIVETSLQKGRRGLGMQLSGFEPTALDWDFEKDKIDIKEPVDWLPSCRQDAPDCSNMVKIWLTEGTKKMRIDDEMEFCSPEVVKKVCQCKSIFDSLEGEEMRRARARANPYETIKGAFFLNRAAVKMANMDARLDFMFTNPVDDHGHSVVGPHDLLYFADVCAGPGGFSEYVLWRKGWRAKGFGLTLKTGDNDFKLHDFFAAPSECFEPHYGVGGIEGDGDIYRPDNLLEFQKFVHKFTGDKGVHFVMADGGFSVEGEENLQEILSKRLYLCQFLCALMILRPGGHFVCKLFDVFTPFSVGLVYLMYRAFQHVTIIKPVTSRPANSERYIVCKWLRPDSLSVREYMFYINNQFAMNSTILSDWDVSSVVPLNILQEDHEFFQYIKESNEVLGDKQAVALVKIQTFVKNTDLIDMRQRETREECLKYWQIPDQIREQQYKGLSQNDIFHKLTAVDISHCYSLLIQPTALTNENLENSIKSLYDYRFYLSSSSERVFLMSDGCSVLWRWNSNSQQKSRWQKFDNLKVGLPRCSIVEVELVNEYKGQARGQLRVTVVHIIDAWVLHNEDVHELHFNERHEKLKMFTKAIHRPTRNDLTLVRVKVVYKLEDLPDILPSVNMELLKGQGNKPCCTYSIESADGTARVCKLESVVLIKTTKDPWMMSFSKSQNRKYFFNTLKRQSFFELPPDSVTSFQDCCTNRLLWSVEDNSGLTKDQLLNFIHKMRR